jgi:hypothetical protein
MNIFRHPMRSIPILLFAALAVLLPGVASAAGPIEIDPVSADLKTGTIIAITGTTTLPAGTELYYEFLAAGLETGAVRNGEYSGGEGTTPVLEGSPGSRWSVAILTEGYAPGEYIFRIGRRGTGDMASVHVHLAQGAPAVVSTRSPQSGGRLFESPYYVSQNADFTVKISPDLDARQNRVAKGSTLTVAGTTVPGGKIGIWVMSGFPRSGYRSFAVVTADGSGVFEYVLPGEDTSSLRSGQYFLYVVDGRDSLASGKENGGPDEVSSPGALEAELNAHEQGNPYQVFMLLVEEPAISIGEIPDSIPGTPLEINGTTNLPAGTSLTLDLVPPDADRLHQPAFTQHGVIIGDGAGGDGEWHAIVDTTDLPPGEYVAKVSGGRAEAATLLVMYDDLYEVSRPREGELVVQTYRVDPGTKTVETMAKPEKSGTPSSTATLVIAGIAGFAGLAAIVATLGKR